MQNNDKNCFCSNGNIQELSLAMAYVVSQIIDETYTPEVALSKGTLFPELYKPFCGRTIESGCRHV